MAGTSSSSSVSRAYCVCSIVTIAAICARGSILIEAQTNVRIRRVSSSSSSSSITEPTFRQRTGAFENHPPKPRRLGISLEYAFENIETIPTTTKSSSSSSNSSSNNESETQTVLQIHSDSNSDSDSFNDSDPIITKNELLKVSPTTTTTTTPNTTPTNNDATDNVFSRIVGGTPSDPGEFPYFVDLGTCAGTLIAPRVVLTAAHCNPQNRIGKTVTVGPTKKKSTDNGPTAQSAETIRVVDAIVHPKFENKGSKYFLNNDFGLLLLERPYTILNSEITFRLNDQTSVPANDQVLDVVGMGVTEYGASSMAAELRDVLVPSISNTECESLIQYGISKKQLCAGQLNGNKDACSGDSGGPLLVRINNNTNNNNKQQQQHIQVGITSWGRDCGKYPGVYSRVSEVYDWIQQKVCTTWQVEAPDLCSSTENNNINDELTNKNNKNEECVDKTKFAKESESTKDCEWVAQDVDERCSLKAEGKTKKYKYFCKQTCGNC